MKSTKIIMGMPVTIEIIDKNATKNDLQDIFNYFRSIDRQFSTYKKDSEISKINRKEILEDQFSQQMKEILALCEQTKKETNGYFDIEYDGKIDPSGLVKGWAIFNAANILKSKGFENYYVDAGGDIQVSGVNSEGEKWKIGIRNPFNRYEIVKAIEITDKGVATSGTAIRGQHIYNPLKKGEKLNDIISITIIGPNIYEADRFATAAFAMGKQGILFIESLEGFEGYMIDKTGTGTFTSGFNLYVI